MKVLPEVISRRAVMRAGLALAGAAVAGQSLAKSAPATAAAVTALSDKLLLVSGLGGNVVALRGDEGLLLVDTGGPGATGKLVAELKKFGGGARVSTVFNTHWHAAQTGGNEVFGKAGAKLIAHAKAAQRLAVDQWVPKEDRYTKAAPKAAVPTEVFYLGGKQLTFGGEHIEYGYLQQAHTDGDIYVYFRDSNVLVVGDAVAPVSDPVIAWFEGGWLGGRADALAKLMTIGNEQTRIVAGTGGVISRAEVKTEQEAITQAFERISEAMRKGFTVEDMQKAKLLDGLPRTWADPDAFIYASEKSMWGHHNTLSYTIV